MEKNTAGTILRLAILKDRLKLQKQSWCDIQLDIKVLNSKSENMWMYILDTEAELRTIGTGKEL